MVTTAGRVYQCGWGTYGKSVQLVQTRNGGAYLRGVKRCNNVWLCAECSYRICAVRREEVNELLAWASGEGYSVLMLTLTAGHSRQDPLASSLETFKAAKERFRQRREWRAVKPAIVGTVTATEVTYGDSGWHVHTHEIFIMRPAVDDAVAVIETLRASWLLSLAAFGRTGNQHAFQVQGAAAACAYVTKFGVAEELTLSGTKEGRKAGRTPDELLEASRQGDEFCDRLWLEYARAFKGRRQLVWSPGLKALCGVQHVADEDAGVADDEVEVLREWSTSTDRWREARRRRLMIVHAVVSNGDLDAAEFGLTDIASLAVLEARERRRQ